MTTEKVLTKSELKSALKAEAKEKGVLYEVLKAQRKQERKERKRTEKMSNDSDDSSEEHTTKKRRKEVSSSSPKSEGTHQKSAAFSDSTNGDSSSDEWRKEHDIRVKVHGAKNGVGGFDLDAISRPYRKFRDAPYCESLQQVFVQVGFERPTPIQSQAWPIAVNNHDMICVAKTGSGKTCGFVLPSIHQHLTHREQNPPHRGGGPTGGKAFLLVLAPTRELALQITEETQKFGRRVGLRTLCLYGGSPKHPQIASLRRGVDILVATPGRLNDLLEMKRADLSGVRHLVLDEADRMLDMGFEPQIRSIVACLPGSKNGEPPRQTLLFSATWPREIRALAHDFLRPDAIQINVGGGDGTGSHDGKLMANKDICQEVIMVSESDKPNQLDQLLDNMGDTNAHPKMIVFVSMKAACDELANQLWNKGYAADSLHGDRAQWERTKVMNAFKSSNVRVLVATDVAARGLDVKDIELVINYDFPVGQNGVEDYVHRIGRTGRAGRKGRAITFFSEKDTKRAKELVELLEGAAQQVPDELRAKVRSFRGGSYGGRGGFSRGRGRFGGGGGRGRGRGRGGFVSRGGGRGW